MANLISSRADLHAPSVFATFLANTTRDLTDTDAPRNAKHLPCGVILSGVGNFVFTDVNGTSNTIVSTAQPVYYPIAPAAMVNTGNVAVSATICWQTRLNAKV